MTDPLERLKAAFRATVPGVAEAARKRAIEAALTAFGRHRPGKTRSANTTHNNKGKDVQMQTIDEMRKQLIAKSTDDQAFRGRLFAEPRAVIEEEFGITVPARVDVRIMEDSPQAVHLVLPPEPKLDMKELQQASGGFCAETCSAEELYE